MHALEARLGWGLRERTRKNPVGVNHKIKLTTHPVETLRRLICGSVKPTLAMKPTLAHGNTLNYLVSDLFQNRPYWKGAASRGRSVSKNILAMKVYVVSLFFRDLLR